MGDIRQYLIKEGADWMQNLRETDYGKGKRYVEKTVPQSHTNRCDCMCAAERHNSEEEVWWALSVKYTVVLLYKVRQEKMQKFV